MKNLNVYGEEFIEKVKAEGKWEDVTDYYQVDSVSVTQSQTNFLINLCVVTHTEWIYIYNKKKYKLDLYNEMDCNEIFTIPCSSTDTKKKELVENFVEDMYSNIFNYDIKDITENEYNNSRDMTREEIKTKIINSII